MTTAPTPLAATLLRSAGLVLALLLLIGCSPATGRPESDTAQPETLQLTLLDGSTLEPLSAQPGRAVWLNFWAGWCRPCLDEWPAINAAATELSPQVQIIAVNVNQDAADVAEFVAQHPAEFSVALDPDGQLAARYGVSGLPTHILIDAHGTVRHVVRGPLDSEQAARLLGLTTTVRNLP